MLTGVWTSAWLASAPGPLAGEGAGWGASWTARLKVAPAGTTTTPETKVTEALKSMVPLWIWNPVKLPDGTPVANQGAGNQMLPCPRFRCVGVSPISMFTGKTPKTLVAVPNAKRTDKVRLKACTQ